MNKAPTLHRSRGFTLIELLVAIGIMAVMAGLSWQGIDGMVRAQTQLQQRADALLTVEAGLGQWSADLDALADGPPEQTLDWDGRGLRLLRRNTVVPGDGLLVVAWSRRTVDGIGYWLRWQSAPLRTRQEQQAAWASAAQWAQNPGDNEKTREVRITSLAQWELFYFRNNAWSHPLSSGSTATGTAQTTTARPDGIRLVLTLPDSEAMHGTLTRDWVRSNLSGGKS
jgi:general secretion pathway protein J